MASASVKPTKADDTEYIVFYEPVTTTVVRLTPSGETETVTVQDKKEHRVPLAEWPEYERSHGWA